MSLINDALKRAKQAHEKQAAPIRSAPLHTPQPAAPSSTISQPLLVGGILILLFFVVLIAGVILLRSGHTTQTPVVIAAAPNQTPPPTPVPQQTIPPPAPTPAVVSPATVAEPPTPAPEPAEVTSPQPQVVAAPAPEPPPFPDVRLQGILYDPSKPAAIINGRTLFLGERFNNIRVTAITKETATVVWNNQTKVLTMER